MKKIIPLLLIAPLFLFSCKKDHSASSGPSGKKYPVTFNVTNFAQQKGVFAVSRQTTNSVKTDDVLTDVGGYLDVLYYYVYDNNNNFVHKIAQDSTMSNLGTVTDTLPLGTYKIIIAAGKKGLVSANESNLFQANIGYGSIDWQDTFFDSFAYTVTNASNNQDVIMHRIVTELELNLTDTIPANANTITMAVYPEFTDYLIGQLVQSGIEDTLKTTITIPSSAKGKAGFTFDKIYGNGNQNTGYDVELTAMDASNHIIGSAHVTNVQSGQGQRTVLSGKLFNSTASGSPQSFQVKVDTAWSTTINQVSFSLRRH